MKKYENIAEQVMNYNSRNFHKLNRKLDLQMTELFRKSMEIKPDHEIRKTVTAEVKMPQLSTKTQSTKQIFLF